MKKTAIGDVKLGMCLGCGLRLTLCGARFTADIKCPNCMYINVFVESQQPIGIRVVDSTGHNNKNNADLS
jgi:hypothetical protein